MQVNLEVGSSEEYFSQVGREIDWEEDDTSKVSIKQAGAIDKILTMEASIFLLRRATGVCGSMIDCMATIRRGLVDEYEKSYETYVQYNDFY
jgi:hypothetical protein